MPWLLLASPLLLASGMDLDAEPPLVPSGMDLLYNDRAAFMPNGEPIVTIGLMTGQKSVTVQGVGGATVQVDFYDAREKGVLKRATIPAGVAITMTLTRSEPAKRRHYVNLDGVQWKMRDKLDWALAGWRARGYPEVEALEEGTVLGIGGRVLDNRAYRIALPVPDRANAQRLADEVYRLFGQRAVARSRLRERPWGEISVKTFQGPLGTATSYVRLVPAGGASPEATVRQVEHGRGYDWHGFEDRAYRGEIYVAIDPDGRLAAVNAVGAEQVLKGVVPSETFAVAPAEALKAQAVAARNHLLAKLGRRHHGDPFHLCSEQHCQVFAGVAREDPRTNAAVEESYGQALFHAGALVHAVYSSTCGGHTEDNDAVWGDHPDPALQGRPDFDLKAHPELATFANGLSETNVADWLARQPATFCSEASFARKRLKKFRWRKRFTATEIQKLLDARYPSLGKLEEMTVRERGAGGRVISLVLTGATGKATVVMELPIRRLFGNLNSGAFIPEIERNPAGGITAVTFVGGGWGHGVGMCQLGAIGRAEAGQTYESILSHYYNGALLKRLYEPLAPHPAQP